MDLKELGLGGRGSHCRPLSQGATLQIKQQLFFFIQVYLREAMKKGKVFPVAGKILLNHNGWKTRKVAGNATASQRVSWRSHKFP